MTVAERPALKSEAALPQGVLDQQIDASNPQVSAFVAANAGSGKTHVLAQRVIRLLLEGSDPSRILCLTFTKTAAANMAKRVFDTLAAWTALDDAALDQAIRATGGKTDASSRTRARRLFAEALETPGGLKVQTIHAFCTRLLHQFPFEANVAARFAVLEERAETELIDRLRLEVLLEAAARPESPLGRALAVAVTAAADTTFNEVVREAIGKRDAVTAWIAAAGGIDNAAIELAHALGIAPEDKAEAVEAEFSASSILPMSEWTSVAAVLATGSPNDQDQARRLTMAAKLAPAARVELLLGIFCTTSLEPRKNVVTATIQKKFPDLAANLAAEQARICALLDRRRAVAARDRTIALLTIADEVISRYRAEKETRGLLDYDDLIDKALGLFNRVSAAWVHYKLDLGIDHVLIDEAQDTSRKQWDVIQAITGEFTAGEGARAETRRTVYAVGDEKQSIFSFQGAMPHQFAEMRRYFEKVHAEGDFVKRRLDYSFRSSPVVLQAVDAVFARTEANKGLEADSVPTAHAAVREQAPGRVDIWELIKPDPKAEIEAWDAPFDTQSETSPQVRLARKIAASVKRAIMRGKRVGKREAGVERRLPLSPGDFLILVRQRGPLFEAIIRALKNAGIEVAGADRLMLTEHVAVMDLMVLGDALLLAADDLALATALKSPLFGLDEDQLFHLAWNRPGTLREALNAAQSDPALADAARKLDRWADAARRETPYSFYARILGNERGRAQILGRLGAEAGDALDEFLNLALDYESRQTPTVQGFLAWLRATETQVKRDMEVARDEVRVMTVHGAKGLEAPVVILADTVSPPAPPQRPLRLIPLPGANASSTPDRLVWAQAKSTDVPQITAAKAVRQQAAEDEYRRLLYVAMTRAADCLIVCGAEGQRARPKGCWYDLVFDALSPLVTETKDEDGGTVWRMEKSVAEEAAAAAVSKGEAAEIPPWLKRDVPPSTPAFVLNPSSAMEDLQPAAVLGIGGAERSRALARGRLIHRLMQSLPDIAPDGRLAAARTFLSRAAATFDHAECQELAAQALAVIDDPRFAPLAGPGSRAEVPVVGRVSLATGAPVHVSGQIDRMAVTADAVIFADYKTNRPAPRRIDDVPKDYLVQLALYRALLAGLYPERTIRAALIWTDIPEFMDIPPAALDAALARITPA